MTERLTDLELETRLRAAFRSPGLPTAPSRLVDNLERVPDGPAALSGDPGSSAAGGRGIRRTIGLLGLAAVLAVGGAVALSGGSGPGLALPSPSTTLVDGVVVTYRVQWTAATPYDPIVLERELAVVRGRLASAGAVGTRVLADGEDGLVVRIPSTNDVDALRKLVGQTGEMAFVPLGTTQAADGDAIDPALFPALFGSDGIADASVGADQTGQRVVTITLSPAAARLFGTYTATHIGEFLAITLDGRVISAPTIQSEIRGGSVEISKNGTAGGWGLAEARTFAAFIRSGALPGPLVELSNTLGPVEPGPADPSASPTAGSPAP
jgi:preprotein translocase subunit SecD